MSESVQRIRVAEVGGTLVVEVAGRATMDTAATLRKHIEPRLQAGGLALQLDLRQCSYMDSTFQGTLLILSGVQQRGAARRLELVCPSPECRRLLRENGFDRVLTVVDAEPLTECVWTEIGIETDRKAAAFQDNVIESHEMIVQMDGPTAERYRAAVQMLKQSRQ
jgi:anti-anti-sigma factor